MKNQRIEAPKTLVKDYPASMANYFPIGKAVEVPFAGPYTSARYVVEHVEVLENGDIRFTASLEA